MEEKIFRQSAVADVLTRSFVEARLHTDGEANVERIHELQAELTRSVATPYYVIVEPDGAVRSSFAGATRDAERFADFLRRGLASS